MPKRLLVVSGDNPRALMKLEVIEADMPHPGWLRFTMEAGLPGWEEPTVCWYRVPAEAHTIEVQSQITDADVMARSEALRPGWFKRAWAAVTHRPA